MNTPRRALLAGLLAGLSLAISPALDAQSCTALPAVPVGLASPAQTPTSVSLSWSAVTPPAGCAVTYRVYSRGIQILSGLTSPSATITGLTANTSYSFTVAAVDAAGLSAHSAALSVKTASGCTTAPAVPTGLASPSQTATSVNLTWSPVTTPAGCAVTYRVYSRGIQILSGITGTSATISGLTANTTYSFIVAAADTAGLSAPSAALSVKTLAGATCASAPPVPTGLASPSQTPTSAHLTWSAVTPPAGCAVTYRVYSRGIQILAGLTSPSATISNLAPGATYSFTVAAASVAGLSAQCAALPVRTQSTATCTAAPAVPTGLASPSSTASSVNLAWNAVTAPANCAVNYTVYQNGSAVATGLTGTSAAITGLSTRTTYSFTVSAVDAAGESAQSQALLATTAPAAAVVNPSGTTPFFMIVNKFSNKALDLIGGDTANGARVNQWSFDYNGANQRWAIVPTENFDHFKLISWVSGKAACIKDDSMDNGAQLHNWEYVGNNPGQQFDLIDAGNGYFKIRNVKSGKVLDDSGWGLGNDNKICQWDDAGGDNQLWRLQPWGDYFVRTFSGRYINVQNGGTTNGSRIQQNDRQDSAGFKWRFLTEGDGWYGLFSLNALSKVLCVEGPSTAAGHYCHLWGYNPVNIGDQKVRLVPQTDGTFKFYFNFTGFAWDIPGGRVGNDAELDQYPDNAGVWQRFQLERIPGASATAASITRQPQDQKVTTGSTATFWVGASASSAITYQWYRNGSAISGATSHIYTTARVGSSDHNATFKVALTANGSTVTSNAVKLTVLTDIDDLMGKASGHSYSSSTPMGTHYQGLHVTTDSDRTWLGDSTTQPPAPSGHSDWQLKTFSVNLYPSGSPSPTDINQHGIGDCNGITAMGNLAYMVPDFVKSCITSNGGGVFTVAMFDPQGKPVSVKVDSQFLADSGGNIIAVTGKNNVATWTTVLEKAIMKYNVIYQADGTIEGIGAENVQALFTGAGNSFAFDRNVLTPSEMNRVIKASLACGKLISGGFGAQLVLGNVKAVTGHGYACYWPANDSTMLCMRNPWGVNPTTSGGYDGSMDGVLNIPMDSAWSGTIDLRITDSGIAGTAGRTSPWSIPAQSAPMEVRLSPAVAGVK